MSRVFTGANNENLLYSGSLGITGYPFSFFGWYKITTSFAGTGFSYANTSTDNFGLEVETADLKIAATQSGASGNATTTNTLTLNAWLPIAGYIDSATSSTHIVALGQTVNGSGINGFATESAPSIWIGQNGAGW